MIDLASFWVGNRLSPLEQASAISFLAQGHRLFLYVMDDVQGIPPGVIVKDARDILPTNHVIRHAKTGSPALHSDLFRYALMGKTNQTWVDLDIIARSPLIFPTDYIFGYESANEVNGAVLRLPDQSPALYELLQYKSTSHGYPPYMKLSRKIKYFLKSLGAGLPIEKWPWGSIGPRALTFHLNKTNEIRHALPISTFYPIPFEHAELFLIPGKITDDNFGNETYAVHFWGNAIRKLIHQKYHNKIPKESYLGKSIIFASEWANFEISNSIE
jgi:hypothetical protein